LPNQQKEDVHHKFYVLDDLETMNVEEIISARHIVSGAENPRNDLSQVT
jgi:hypothetical protein